MNTPLKKGYPCTFFIPPNGKTKVRDIRNMSQDDFDWFLKNKVKLSGETLLDNTYAFYADVGIMLDDDVTPMEAIQIAPVGSCPFHCFAELRKRAEGLLS